MRKVKIGIDNYSYHNCMGWPEPDLKVPERLMTLDQYLDRAKELDVDGVSLESIFFPEFGTGYLSDLRGKLDEYGFDRVFAWGHPNGLEGGKNLAAYEQMLEMMDYASQIGATVMRIVASSRRFRSDNHDEQIERLSRMFSDSMGTAESHGLKLAVENHIDFNINEMATLIDNVNHPDFGINFDTGNFVRLLDDPIKGMEKLAKKVFAVHFKDLWVKRDEPVDSWRFFSSTPVGKGLVDAGKLAQMLYDSGFQGFLAVEIDYPHPDFITDVDTAVAESIQELDRIVRNLK